MSRKYPPLPIMQCDPNCGECCGIVMCSDSEYDKISEYVQNNRLTPKSQGITCPWYQNGTCAVHPVRPGICRLFGHVDNMVCCKGHNSNIGSRLQRQWEDKLMNPKPTRILHEVLDDWKDIIAVGIAAEMETTIPNNR